MIDTSATQNPEEDKEETKTAPNEVENKVAEIEIE